MSVSAATSAAASLNAAALFVSPSRVPHLRMHFPRLHQCRSSRLQCHCCVWLPLRHFLLRLPVPPLRLPAPHLLHPRVHGGLHPVFSKRSPAFARFSFCSNLTLPGGNVGEIHGELPQHLSWFAQRTRLAVEAYALDDAAACQACAAHIRGLLHRRDRRHHLHQRLPHDWLPTRTRRLGQCMQACRTERWSACKQCDVLSDVYRQNAGCAMERDVQKRVVKRT